LRLVSATFSAGKSRLEVFKDGGGIHGGSAVADDKAADENKDVLNGPAPDQ